MVTVDLYCAVFVFFQFFDDCRARATVGFPVNAMHMERTIRFFHFIGFSESNIRWLIDWPTPLTILSKGRALTVAKKHAEKKERGQAWVVQEYVNNHAIRKGDVAKAVGFSRTVRNRSGVKGRGQYKMWTAPMMLRASFHVRLDGFGVYCLRFVFIIFIQI